MGTGEFELVIRAREARVTIGAVLDRAKDPPIATACVHSSTSQAMRREVLNLVEQANFFLFYTREPRAYHLVLLKIDWTGEFD